jgi:nucleoside-diphosphate-sugar epimerase
VSTLPGPIVVLGGGGFIGSNLVQRLTGDGHDVTAVDVQRPGFRLGALAGARWLTADLTDSAEVRRAVDGAGTVFHLAADMGGVAWFHSDKDWQAALTNGRITTNVLEACGRMDVGRLVYASSACACATENQQKQGWAPLLTEADMGWGSPDARYGAEKRHGAYLCGTAPFDARVAVLHTVYGPLQEHEGQRMKFPSAVAMKALRARDTGTLELWGDGTQLRTYLYIDDAVDRLVALAEAGTNPGPVMVGATGAVTCIDVARTCLAIAGVPDAEIVTVPGPVGVQSRDCDLTRWTGHFGVPHQTSIEDGFRRFMAWLDQL